MDFEESEEKKTFDYRGGGGGGIKIPEMYVNPNKFANAFGQGDAAKKPNFIQVEGVTGRDVFSRMAYDCGISWGLGMTLISTHTIPAPPPPRPEQRTILWLNKTESRVGGGGF